MKKGLKNALLVLLVFCAFVAGLFYNSMKRLKEFEAPPVYSDTRIRDLAKAELGFFFPETAHHLYYSERGWIDTIYYVAFSLNSKEECEKYLKEKFGSEMELKEAAELSKHFKDGPDTWEGKYKDKNWSLAGKSFLLIEGRSRVAYVPEENRIYFSY